jgi:SpoVK/Ycf46/Vps4 family AAA+-type ATPase
MVSTANDISQLSPELLRKGRFDEIFFVELPSEKERQQIWEIQISNCGRNHGDFDVTQLAKMTDGLSICPQFALGETEAPVSFIEVGRNTSTNRELDESGNLYCS